MSRMSMPASRAHSEVFSASQYGGPVMSGVPAAVEPPYYRINYFIIPIFILEVIGLACLWALFYYLRFTDVFPYHQRVFWCQDLSLWFPNYEPQNWLMYVAPETLYCLSFIIPPFVIVIGETMFYLFSTKPRKAVYGNCYTCKLPLVVRRICRFTGVFMFGALIVCIFIDSIKLITGFQRPYFLSLCKVNNSYCRNPANTITAFNPIQNPRIACQHPVDSELRYAWLTFPSLYAGLSSYAAIFTSLYIFFMIRYRGAILLRPFLIAGFLGMSLIASFSRIQGYKNHWIDVWVGWLIGLAWAFLLCWCVRCFQEQYKLVEKEVIEEPISPFWSWFRLPRIQARPKEDTYSVYTKEESPPATPARHRARDTNKEYEVTTTTESFQRTIAPPGSQPPMDDNFTGRYGTDHEETYKGGGSVYHHNTAYGY